MLLAAGLHGSCNSCSADQRLHKVSQRDNGRGIDAINTLIMSLLIVCQARRACTCRMLSCQQLQQFCSSWGPSLLGAEDCCKHPLSQYQTLMITLNAIWHYTSLAPPQSCAHTQGPAPGFPAVLMSLLLLLLLPCLPASAAAVYLFLCSPFRSLQIRAVPRSDLW